MAKAKPKAQQEPRPLSLFEIDQLMMDFMRRLTDGGELTPEEDSYYSALCEQAKEKCDSYVSAMVYMKSQAEAASLVKKMVEEKLRKWESAHERLRERLTVFMSNHGVKELRPKSPALPCVYLQPGRQKINYNVERIPADLLIIETVKKPDKEKIEGLIKELGQERLGELPAGITMTQGDPFIMMR